MRGLFVLVGAIGLTGVGSSALARELQTGISWTTAAPVVTFPHL